MFLINPEFIDLLSRPMGKRRDAEAIEVLAATGTNIRWSASGTSVWISLRIDR
ncbi:TPA: hypothetical protein QDB05_000018 [Burkholderia vietnamiensis]|nr:hypothetical protein [Burkholderia vietnamiensis]